MFLLSIFKITGHSMEPAIRSGSKVFATKIPYLFLKPKVNDVIAFKNKSANKIFIKRIKKIKNKEYFVQGDNQSDSLDSRQIGWINKEDIIGKII